EKLIIKNEKNFWENHIKKNIPPEPISLKDIKLRYPNSDGGIIQANHDIIINCESLAKVKSTIKKLQEDEKFLQAKILKYMKNNEILEDDNGQKIATWKNVKPRILNQKLLKEEHPDLYEAYTIETQRRELRLKIKI
ncbi:MAG: hypothetical protein ACFFD1_00005, partial [Candidatus Thorarchaeota archaeon]